MICIPIKSKDTASLLKSFTLAQKEADVIEVWFDELRDLSAKSLGKIFSKKKKPIIYKSTNPSKNLKAILGMDVDFVDLDIATAPAFIKTVKAHPKTQLIISYHDFKKTPTIKKLKEIAQKAEKLKADIIKISTFARTFTDSLRMLQLLDDLTQSNKRAICICMGKQGRLTRVTGHLLDNYLMYAPLTKEEKTAAGQITAKELKKIINLIG
jgi:3-dehydroquinate dehydratase type I